MKKKLIFKLVSINIYVFFSCFFFFEIFKMITRDANRMYPRQTTFCALILSFFFLCKREDKVEILFHPNLEPLKVPYIY